MLWIPLICLQKKDGVDMYWQAVRRQMHTSGMRHLILLVLRQPFDEAQRFGDTLNNGM